MESPKRVVLGYAQVSGQRKGSRQAATGLPPNAATSRSTCKTAKNRRSVRDDSTTNSAKFSVFGYGVAGYSRDYEANN